METFRQSRLVLPVADEETFVLARDPERISIKEILDCVRNSGAKKPASEPTKKSPSKNCFGKSTTRWRKL